MSSPGSVTLWIEQLHRRLLELAPPVPEELQAAWRSRLSRSGNRPARIGPLCRGHLAKHFAETFSRIGLPRPDEAL